MFQQIGKVMLIVGAGVAGTGALFYVLGRLGVTKLPGDFSFGGRNWRVYFPIGICIIVSAVLTVVIWLVTRVRR